jgi:hypothetical protein
VAAVIVAGYWLAQAATLARNVRQMGRRTKKFVGAGSSKADPKAGATEAGAPNTDASQPRESAGK